MAARYAYNVRPRHKGRAVEINERPDTDLLCDTSLIAGIRVEIGQYLNKRHTIVTTSIAMHPVCHVSEQGSTFGGAFAKQREKSPVIILVNDKPMLAQARQQRIEAAAAHARIALYLAYRSARPFADTSIEPPRPLKSLLLISANVAAHARTNAHSARSTSGGIVRSPRMYALNVH